MDYSFFILNLFVGYVVCLHDAVRSRTFFQEVVVSINDWRRLTPHSYILQYSRFFLMRVAGEVSLLSRGEHTSAVSYATTQKAIDYAV